MKRSRAAQFKEIEKCERQLIAIDRDSHGRMQRVCDMDYYQVLALEFPGICTHGDVVDSVDIMNFILGVLDV